jgi:hypothetical protein
MRRYAIFILGLSILAAVMVLWQVGTSRAADAVAADANAALKHAATGYDALLREHVDEQGLVDYAALGQAPQRLDRYIEALRHADPAAMSDYDRLATLINAYNAFTLRLMLDYPNVASIMEIPEDRRWTHRRWDLGRQKVSLDHLEHGIIRVDFDEPRIHWAVVCAAISCPPLRPEAYVGERLDAQLAEQAETVHTSPKWLRYRADRNRLQLTPLYDWYGSDFGESEAAIVANVAPYVPQLQAGDRPAIEWLPYDWSLNAQ